MFLRLHRFFTGLIVLIRETLVQGRDLREQLYLDLLTGLLNRAAFLYQARQALAAARRNTRVLTVVSIDLDGLKQKNDSSGHGAGDALLRDFGEALRVQLRPTDLAGRVGGDEFVLVLQDTNETEARTLLHRLRQEYPDLPFSFGLCVAQPTRWVAVTLESILIVADQRMYEDKRARKAA